MSDLIHDTIPLNLIEERAKFFADYNYNPQFKYTRSFTQEELQQWGTPLPAFCDQAEQMVKMHRPLLPTDPIVTVEDVERIIAEYNDTLQFNPPLSVEFSERAPSRCRLVKNTLIFHLPLTYTNRTFGDLMRHEIETHYLRKLNQQKQSWADFQPVDNSFRRTEEGLANLHTHLLREQKLILKTYRTYHAVCLAQTQSFSKVFQALLELGVSPGTAFLLTFRTKRGLEDTALPGGLTKDLCYFEGSVQVWQWLMQPDNDPKDLYLGRIGLEHIDQLKPSASKAGLHYPSFFKDLPAYLEAISDIGRINHFEQLIK